MASAPKRQGENLPCTCAAPAAASLPPHIWLAGCRRRRCRGRGRRRRRIHRRRCRPRLPLGPMQRGRQDRTRPRSSSRRHFETRAGRHGPGGRWLAGSRCRSCGSTARRFRPGGCRLGSSSCRPGSGAAHRHLPFQPLNPARVISMDGEDNSLTAPTCKELQKLCDVVWQQTRACWLWPMSLQLVALGRFAILLALP